jgi:hypothetical protein
MLVHVLVVDHGTMMEWHRLYCTGLFYQAEHCGALELLRNRVNKPEAEEETTSLYMGVLIKYGRSQVKYFSMGDRWLNISTYFSMGDHKLNISVWEIAD